MKFHKVYSRVVLPLDAFLNLSSLFVMLMEVNENGLDLYSGISLAVTILFIILCFAAFRGLKYFQRSGYRAVLALLSIQILNNLYSIYVALKLSDISFVIAYALSIWILAMVMLYYIRRRPLFTRDGIGLDEQKAILARRYGGRPEDFEKNYREATKAYEEQMSQMEAKEEEPEEIGEYDCPRCGHHITDGAVFCPKCGAQTRVVRR